MITALEEGKGGKTEAFRPYEMFVNIPLSLICHELDKRSEWRGFSFFLLFFSSFFFFTLCLFYLFLATTTTLHFFLFLLSHLAL